jgi:phosphoesterase RecJ-like protein
MKKKASIDDYFSLKKILKDLHKVIRKSRAVIIAGHVNPDGDDIASQLAIGEYLKSAGKKYVIAWSDDVPKAYRFLPNSDTIVNISKNPIDPGDYDLFIIVDSGDIDRIGDVRNLILPGHKVVNIDHHRSNTFFGDMNIVSDKACSIGEILYLYFIYNGISVTKEIAVDLYVSIVTDTGSFNYDCMHAEVHEIAADLMRHGIVPADFNIFLYQNRSEAYMNLLTKTLSNLELSDNSRIAFSHLFYNDFIPGDEDDTDGLIEYIGMIEKVSVYVLIKEKTQGVFTASMRSKYNVDVARIASSFNGGGHMRAAGCRTDKMSFEEFKAALTGKIKEQLQDGR